LKIEFCFPENLSIGCCAAILNRVFFDLFDLFSIGSCAAILNRDFFDLFDFLLKNGVHKSRVLSTSVIFDDFKGYRGYRGYRAATGPKSADKDTITRLQVRTPKCKHCFGK
jgi:hypothetical protein